jgi:alkylation response protein AidB-like acyl-CoA dehydrogenase
MEFMQADREACDRLLPGLRERLTELPLRELESVDSPAMDLFRSHGGPALLIPADRGGLGSSALDAVRVVRVIGSLAPSLAVATAMHHFSIGMLYSITGLYGQDTEIEPILERVSRERLLVASGFAEGKSNQGILSPGTVAKPVPGGYLVNGAKKPCSLSRSMGLFTGSVAVPREDGTTEMGLLLLPADTPGISVHEFWSTFPLAAAESNEVRLTDVFVEPTKILRPPPDLAARLSELEEAATIWFQMIVAAVYTGMVSRLAELVRERARGAATDRARLLTTVDSAAMLAEGVARRVMSGDTGNDCAAAALVTRFSVRELLTQALGLAVELLGGMSYIQSPDVAYLVAAVPAVAFHPPSRTSMTDALLDYYSGKPFVMA